MGSSQLKKKLSSINEDFTCQLEEDLSEFLNPEGYSSVEDAFEQALEDMVDSVKPREELDKEEITKIKVLEEKLTKDISDSDWDEWL